MSQCRARYADVHARPCANAHDAGHRLAFYLGSEPRSASLSLQRARRTVPHAWTLSWLATLLARSNLFLARCRRSKLAAFGGSAWAAAGIVPSAVSLASCSPDVRAPDQTREGALTAPSRDWLSRSGLTRRPELARPFRSVSRTGATPTERPLHSIPGTAQSRDRQGHRCARTALRPVRLARRPRFADRDARRRVLRLVPATAHAASASEAPTGRKMIAQGNALGNTDK